MSGRRRTQASPVAVSALRHLQSRLADVLRANTAASTVEHVVVALPSHSMPQRLLTHHASHLAALEHRALLDGLQVAGVRGARVVVVASADPSPAVLDYYAHLARPDAPDEARRRLTCLVVPDDGARGVAAKLLDRPDLLTRLRDHLGDAPAFIEPWNVTADEEAVALALDVPVNGGPHELWPLGFKSAARRLFREAGLAVPLGVEDVRDVPDVVAAVTAMRHDRPDLDRVVVKLDNSGAGEGNWVLRTRDATGRPLTAHELGAVVRDEVPAWYLADLVDGGIVEELVTGRDVRSPSAQAQIRPGGDVRVLATHEQVLGGRDGQVFTGSRFPADPSYAAELGRHVAAVAGLLAQRGALGWVAIDVMARRRDDGWELLGIDLNLRKGGTTHSYAALQHLVPGSYDPDGSRWTAAGDGSPRAYRSGDAVGDPGWPGMPPQEAIAAVAAAGLAFDHASRTGVVLHMFPSLERDGTIGVTAIGRSSAEADRLFAAVPQALDAAARVRC